MSKLKTGLLVAGTVVATGAVCNYLTDGAVVDALTEKWSALTGGCDKEAPAPAGDAE